MLGQRKFRGRLESCGGPMLKTTATSDDEDVLGMLSFTMYRAEQRN